MADITAQPYARWLEQSLRQIVALRPITIGIVEIMPDGTTGTHYYNADNRDRLIMCEAIQIDSLEELIRINAGAIKEILEGEDDDGKSD